MTWRKFFGDLFGKPDPTLLWRRYLLALGLILSLIFMSHLFSLEALQRAESDAENINLSGRQRMLSQRILHAADRYAETGDPQRLEMLEDSLDLFETSHARLAEFGRGDPELNDIYFGATYDLDRLSRRYAALGRRIADSPAAAGGALDQLDQIGTGPLLDRLDRAVAAFEDRVGERSGGVDAAKAALRELDNMGTDLMLTRLDRAVTGFENLAGKHAARLETVQSLSLLAAVLAILIEAGIIFWPAHRTVVGALRKLRRENAKKQAALDRLTNFSSIAADLFWETDLDARVTYAEGRFLNRMMGRREDLLGCSYLDLMSFDTRQMAKMAEAIESLKPYQALVGTFVDVDGRTYQMELSGIPRFDENGELAGYLGTADDVTKRVKEKEMARQLALCDPLTGLANKRAFETDLKTALSERAASGRVYALAIDLDGFKPVNDTYGHGAGDEVLKIVAARIKSVLRAGDWAARTGGDEFFVVSTSAQSRAAADSLAQRLNAKLCEPCGLSNGKTVRVSASIGVACAPEDARSYDDLIDVADAALYEAKRGGRNAVRFAGGDAESAGLAAG